jgi:hypothetical protein
MLANSLLKAKRVTSYGLPIYATSFPSNALLPASSNITGRGWVFSNLGNYLVSGVSGTTVGVVTTGSGTSGGTAFSGTTSTAGAHTGSTLNKPIRNLSPGGDTLWQATDGNHTHSVSINWANSGGSGYHPSNKALGFFSNPSTDTIPAGSIVFANSQPEGNFSLYTGHNGNYIGTASTTGQISTNVGAASFALGGALVGAAPAHYHSSGTTGGAVQNTSNPLTPFYPLGQYLGTGVPHIHSVSGTFSHIINTYIFVKPWISNSDNYISRGCIVLWNSTSTVLPPGWAFCNGTAVRGFTTPNLNQSKVLKISSTDTHGSVIAGTNQASASLTVATDSWSHYHNSASTSSLRYDGITTGNHSTTSVSHSHTISVSAITLNPAMRNLAFIIYLP